MSAQRKPDVKNKSLPLSDTVEGVDGAVVHVDGAVVHFWPRPLHATCKACLSPLQRGSCQPPELSLLSGAVRSLPLRQRLGRESQPTTIRALQHLAEPQLLFPRQEMPLLHSQLQGMATCDFLPPFYSSQLVPGVHSLSLQGDPPWRKTQPEHQPSPHLHLSALSFLVL